MASWSRSAVALVAALLLGSLGCLEGDRECYPTDWRACTCTDGAPGYQQCDAAGEAYGACDCSGAIPALTTGPAAGTGGATTGAGGEAGAAGGALKGFLEPCATNEECESGLCYPFMAKGPHCSLPCSGAADCPPPSPGCNMMGICKVP